jgi:cobalt/nickel transport protein
MMIWGKGRLPETERLMRSSLCLLLGLACACPSAAHYNMLLPDSASARKGAAVTLTYQWGHPFEHELFDAPRPTSLQVVTPDGKQTDLLDSLEKSSRKAGAKEVVVYQLKFTPQMRGDHVFLLRTPPLWMEEEGEFLEDVVKVVLHVQAQKGWERQASPDFEIEPLTRPYGLQAGMVFQARLSTSRPQQRAMQLRPLAGTLVEVEHYNPQPPAQMPPDEHITYTARTGPDGVVTTTLTAPGWWGLTAAQPGPNRMHGDKLRPGRKRSTLWVFVDERMAAK